MKKETNKIDNKTSVTKKTVATASKKTATKASSKKAVKKEDGENIAAVPVIDKAVEEDVHKDEPSITVREYNPVTRSVLDSPDTVSGPVYRYSDEELNEFRELILKRLEKARENLAYYQGLITRKDGAGDDSDNRLNSMEDGSGAMEREQVSQLAARQIQFINNLEKALIRIENKTYGICRITGKLIDKARLRAVPHATLSIEAKMAQK